MAIRKQKAERIKKEKKVVEKRPKTLPLTIEQKREKARLRDKAKREDPEYRKKVNAAKLARYHEKMKDPVFQELERKRALVRFHKRDNSYRRKKKDEN
jgi:hypothetical protein